MKRWRTVSLIGIERTIRTLVGRITRIAVVILTLSLSLTLSLALTLVAERRGSVEEGTCCPGLRLMVLRGRRIELIERVLKVARIHGVVKVAGASLEAGRALH